MNPKLNPKLNSKLNPEKITLDNPEATEEWFTKAQPASDILIELFGNAIASEMLKPKKHKNTNNYSNNYALQKAKNPSNIWIDPEIVNIFKKSGAGWQIKINEALKDWLKTHTMIS